MAIHLTTLFENPSTFIQAPSPNPDESGGSSSSSSSTSPRSHRNGLIEPNPGTHGAGGELLPGGRPPGAAARRGRRVPRGVRPERRRGGRRRRRPRRVPVRRAVGEGVPGGAAAARGRGGAAARVPGAQRGGLRPRRGRLRIRGAPVRRRRGAVEQRGGAGVHRQRVASRPEHPLPPRDGAGSDISVEIVLLLRGGSQECWGDTNSAKPLCLQEDEGKLSRIC